MLRAWDNSAWWIAPSSDCGSEQLEPRPERASKRARNTGQLLHQLSRDDAGRIGFCQHKLIEVVMGRAKGFVWHPGKGEGATQTQGRFVFRKSYRFACLHPSRLGGNRGTSAASAASSG